jgi:DNA ligase-1
MFKPLLATTMTDPKKLKFPLIASPKLDGIRCIVRNGMPLTRRGHPIPNRYIRKKLSGLLLSFDGELMVPDGDFNDVQHAVMTEEGEPDFIYYVFDTPNESLRYLMRLQVLNNCELPDNTEVLETHIVKSYDEVLAYHEDCINRGAEGVILRSKLGIYKYGRSTEKEGIMVKVKRFHDDEATVVGVTELFYTNKKKPENIPNYEGRKVSETGRISKNQIASLQCQYKDVFFSLGTGFTEAQREELWAMGQDLIGKRVTFKYQELSKMRRVPRFPVFKAIRKD